MDTWDTSNSKGIMGLLIGNCIGHFIEIAYQKHIPTSCVYTHVCTTHFGPSGQWHPCIIIVWTLL